MRLSVILLLYRSRPFIEKCLTTLLPALDASGPRSESEIILIDQGSGDGAAQWAENFLRKENVVFKLVTPGKNLGVAGGRNAGARAASGEWLIFLDTDTECRRPAVFQELLAAAVAHPNAAILAPRLVTGAGAELQKSARHFPRPLDLAANRLTRMGLPGFAARARRYHLDDFAFDAARPVPWIAGACQLMKRAVFLELGGFDEYFFYGLEETDHCLNGWRAGHEVWFIPAGPLYHATQRLSSKSLRFLWLHSRSALRYFRKNGKSLAAAEANFLAALNRQRS